jgi:hypothetical protein
MLVDLDHSLHLAIDEYCSNKSLKYIPEDFARFVKVQVSVIDLEVFLKRISDKAIDFRLFGPLLFKFLLLPFGHFLTDLNMTARLLLIV